MERTPVESEALKSVGYRDGTLEIEFTTGSVYRYFDVPSHIHDALMAAESHGSFFSGHIRGHFRYARV